ARPPDFLGQRLSEAWPIDRMNGIEQGDGLFRLVGLQRAHEMQFNAAMPLFQRWPFRLRLLHAILTEHPLPRGDHGLDRIRAECFGNRNKCYRGRIAPRLRARAHDLIAHLCQGRFDETRCAAHHAILTRRRRFAAWDRKSLGIVEDDTQVWRRPARRRLTPWRMLTR